MRKLIWCEERLKKEFDNFSSKEVKEMIGFVMPEKQGGKIKWEVTTLFEGEGFTADSQFEAEVIANQQMILALLLKQKR